MGSYLTEPSRAEPSRSKIPIQKRAQEGARRAEAKHEPFPWKLWEPTGQRQHDHLIPYKILPLSNSPSLNISLSSLFDTWINYFQRNGVIFLDLRPLIHLLIPLCIHWIAEEMTVSVLVDVTSAALCPGSSTCSDAIYLNGIQQTVVGLFKMVVLPLLGQLSDDYGRKPLLLLIVSTSIFPFGLLAINQSREAVYGYYVLRTISYIFSQGSIFCISVAYVADILDEGQRAAAFSWITGLFSASHVIGNLLAWLLPQQNVFLVSVGILIICPVYMQFFLVETVKQAPMQEHNLTLVSKSLKIFKDRYNSMKYATTIVFSSSTLQGISLVSFFYELGMSGISSIILYYLKALFGFDKSQLSQILMVVGAGSIVSQILVLPLINPLVGDKAILCMGLLASVAYALLYGVAWSPWTYAIISKASSSSDQGKAQGFVAGVQAIATWFLSSNAPFDCKGFSIIVASFSLMVALALSWTLKSAPTQNNDPKDDLENIEAPLLS
ncbi:LOW QUALITY PROTEIN: hypothetical protein V2J09_008234 [Rumex salicifolius]